MAAKRNKKTVTAKKSEPSSGICFIIMPFGSPFDRYFANIFAPAAVDANLDPVRADSLFASTQIISDIWRLTREATVLLADLSGKNPNVFYELGLAHALGKPVVLVANNIDDVPFDLRSLRVIVYEKEDESWGEHLRERVVNALLETCKDLASAVPLPFVDRPQIDRPKGRSHHIRDSSCLGGAARVARATAAVDITTGRLCQPARS